MMKSSVLNALAAIASLGAVFSPLPCLADDLDQQLDCTSSPHEFIGALLDSQSIDPKPMRIEANSVNSFRPSRGTQLNAFGFHVYAVFGYEQDEPMFKQGSGQPVKPSTYGVVVRAAAASVEASVRRAGSGATVHEVIPFLLTAVYCNGH
ncbi:hypothetical protein [Paraburkholderia sp. D15]|uniref:hypothetical protein n=1 Tax=Paraburkholderia sp. D15 TaxID=2880218 RepID=UPI0032B03F6D